MNFENVSGAGESSGTCLQGNIVCSYSLIEDTFGPPEDLALFQGITDGKVDVEWVIKFEDDTIATIYNWKNGPMYRGPVGIDPKNNEDWHIGGHSPDAVSRVKDALFVGWNDETANPHKSARHTSEL